MTDRREGSDQAVAPPRRLVALEIDGQAVKVPEGGTVLDACRAAGRDQPTLCYGPTLEPRNACRICVVEVESSRVLVPACSRQVEADMVVQTDTARVRRARKLVIELLGSSTELDRSSHILEWSEIYGADPDRFGPPAPPDARDQARAGEHEPSPVGAAATVGQPPKVDNELYVRDYARCILCYKCVDACGEQWQNTFAIAVAGRGFGARISTEWAAALPESACVYCGNCIAVCPTGALVPRTEHDMRAEGTWDESAQSVTTTVCPYCGVGCNLELHVQADRIVAVTSPEDHDVTHGNLCVKGRFGFTHVEGR